jgi:hypothetical protein
VGLEWRRHDAIARAREALANTRTCRDYIHLLQNSSRVSRGGSCLVVGSDVVGRGHALAPVGTPLSWRPRARPFGVGTGPKKRWHEIGDAGDRRWGTVTAERQRREGSLSPLARQPTVAPPRDVYPSASPADRRFCQRRDFFPLRSASLMTVAVKDRSSRASLKAGWGLSRRYGSDGPRRTPDSLTRSCGDRIRARRQWSLRSSAR